MLRNLTLHAVGAVALATSPVAAATTIQSYGLSFTAATNAAVNGTAGNSAIYTATAADGSTLSATVTAWNATLATSGANAGKYVISQAYLGRYTDGLGVTSAATDAPAGFGCGTAGGCGSQQIDNVGNASGTTSYDFLQLSFNAPVTLSSFTRVSSGTANGSTTPIFGGAVYDYDDDFSYGSAAAVSDGLTLSSLASLFQTSVGNNGACGSILAGLTGCNDTSTLTGDAASKNWFLGASIGTNLSGDSIADSFKAQVLTVSAGQTSAVPETSTWTMMILGFGGIGWLVRRRHSSIRYLFSN